jgi:hypothetical protein
MYKCYSFLIIHHLRIGNYDKIQIVSLYKFKLYFHFHHLNMHFFIVENTFQKLLYSNALLVLCHLAFEKLDHTLEITFCYENCSDIVL